MKPEREADALLDRYLNREYRKDELVPPDSEIRNVSRPNETTLKSPGLAWLMVKIRAKPGSQIEQSWTSLLFTECDILRRSQIH